MIRRRAGRGRAPLSLLLPACLTVALLLLPLAYLVVRASGGGGRGWRVLTRSNTLELIWSTGLLVAGVTLVSVTIGVSVAWLTTRTDLPGRRFWAVAAALPLVIPSYVAAFCLLGAFGPRGLLQQLLGVERLPEIYGYWGALAALTLSTYPYVLLLVSAALRGLDPALEEAGRGLGRTPLEVFRRVTLPALRPSIGAGALLVALYTLSDFGVVSLMRYDALTRAIYLQYKSLFDRTPAAVLALVLVVLTALVLWLESRWRRRVSRSGPGTARQARPQRLGRWRWPALAYCSAVVGAFLAVPATVLVYWLARGLDRAEMPWREAANSMTASSLAALAAVVAALPIALLATRYRTRLTALLERLSFAGNALPGIVIALSLVFFAANYASRLYQTLALLVFAYVVRFLPQALAGIESALASVNPRVEEAARALGRGPAAAALTVTVPLIRSGIFAGAALVFLSAMKELPATLLLRPIGFETLATEIWKLTSVGSYSRAAVPALVLIVVSAPFVYFLSSRHEPTGVEHG
ncbi:MAG TPA: iron ABC transporter permease [Gaiellaceae bacterium]|nr:iron ABC transporter permease [Gaiellaceae bacterium]